MNTSKLLFSRRSLIPITFSLLLAACQGFPPPPARPVQTTRPQPTAVPAASVTPQPTSTPIAVAGLDKINHVIVIYQENWSFDSYFGYFPGANGLANAGDAVKQVDKSGKVLSTLPQPLDNSKTPAIPDPRFPATMTVAPYDATQYVPPDQKTGDMWHRFYQEQYQIDGGKMDKFVSWSDNGGLVMSYYDATNMPEGKLAQDYTLADNFFHAAFGGSFLNHFWTVCACTPTWPNAPAGRVTQLDATGIMTKDGSVTPDGFAVNTVQPLNQPHAKNVTDTAQLLPLQTMPTIGDRLSDKGISWAWYSGGWNDAVAGKPDPLFQFHHQVFNYFANYADGKPARAEHLKDITDFQAALVNNSLPAVSFVKPLGADNEHPGYASVVQGQQYVADLVKAVQNSSFWKDTAIIITYDENGGRWDHVAPPKAAPVADRWGPGTRVPTIIISPYAKKHFVDHTQYDTTSILKFIETRWGIAPLGSRDAAVNDLTAAFDFSATPELAPTATVTASTSMSQTASPQAIQHVLLISVDGLHAIDLANFVTRNPTSSLASLGQHGIVYSQASASKPSDSFPGLLALVTGGSPKTTGVYYDDSYDRKLLPPLAAKAGDKPGTEVVYDESIDKDLNQIDGGGGINPDALPRDPDTKQPVYPHSFLRVNTLFEVIKAAGLHTAWSDKHPAYELVNGPSGTGVDDLYTPEIAANTVTNFITATEAYDDLKVMAILNEIHGKDHTGTHAAPVPAIFGMNFQAVSVAQKLPGNGYTDAGGTPSDGLAEALRHTDQSLGMMIDDLKKQHLFDSTLIIVTAKHGQSPIDPTQLKITNKKALTAGIEDGVIAQLTADDVALIWLTDSAQTQDVVAKIGDNKAQAAIQDVYSFGVSTPAWPYDNPTSDSRTPDIVVQPQVGVIYTKPGAKIAEHGGFTDEDTHVALLLSYAGFATSRMIDTPVQTKQVAPTILKALSLDPNALQAVKLEKTPVLPGAGF